MSSYGLMALVAALICGGVIVAVILHNAHMGLWTRCARLLSTNTVRTLGAWPLGAERPTPYVTTENTFGVRLLAALAGLEIHTAGPVDHTQREPSEADDNFGQAPSSPSVGEDGLLLGPGSRLPGADLAGRFMAGVDLSASDLSDSTLARANLRNANLSRADLSRARVNDADLSMANLTRSNMRNANFASAVMVEADMSWSNVSGADFSRAQMGNVILIGVTWTRETTWPEDLRELVVRRSVQVADGIWQVTPQESDDRVLV